jgi:hypothetical protein
MTTFLLVLMALLLIAALERNNRRQPPHPPGMHGVPDRDDRDWARIKSDLDALGDQADLEQAQRSSDVPSSKVVPPGKGPPAGTLG